MGLGVFGHGPIGHTSCRQDMWAQCCRAVGVVGFSCWRTLLIDDTGSGARPSDVQGKAVGNSRSGPCVAVCHACAASCHAGVKIGEVEKDCTADVTVLISELLASCRLAKPAVPFDDTATVTARLLAYARSVAHFPTAVKEFPWRNGYFWDISQAAVSEGKADPAPTHSAWLKEYAPSVVPSGIASW